MNTVTGWFWAIMSYIGYSITVRHYLPGEWWAEGRPMNSKKCRVFVTRELKTRIWRFNVGGPFYVDSRAADSFTNCHNPTKEVFAPIKGNVLIFKMKASHTRRTEIALVFDGRRWRRLTAPDSVTAFEIITDKEQPEITLRLGEQNKVTVELRSALDFLGGLVDAPTLLLLKLREELAERERQNRELLAPALTAIRNSKSYCRQPELAEAAKALEQVLQQ